MTATTLKTGTGSQLTGLLEGLVGSVTETLSSLVGREIELTKGEIRGFEPQEFANALPRRSAVARGAMDKKFAGKTFWSVFELADAITMSGLLMMTPEEVITARRDNETLEEGEEAAAFSELGNVLYSGFGNLLREKVGDIDIRMQDHAVLAPGDAAAETMGSEQLLTFAFTMKVGEFPESTGFIAIDMDTAAAWNGEEIQLCSDAVAEDASAIHTGTVRTDDDGLESIPAAPIRGSLAAYLVQSDTFRILRRSCRRVGLELKRHGRGEIPNPAAHRGQIVVLEVPASEDRRFDWCRRIKDLSDTTPVVLLLRHPSRQRVTQAFLSKADAILGFPCEEPQLSQKLDTLVPDDSPSDEPASEE